MGFLFLSKACVSISGYSNSNSKEIRAGKANYEKQDYTVRRASLPLSVSDLWKSKEKLNQENFNWLYLSVWLGLRPQEMEDLHNLSLWKLEKNSTSTGKDILWVFQTKIVHRFDAR